MKTKKIIILTLAFALLCSFGAVVYGAAAEISSGIAVISERVKGFPFFLSKGSAPNLTDQQKSEVEKKMSEIRAIVESGLTEEEKAELAKHQGKFKFHTEMTDEEKARIEAQRAEQEAKWEALSKAQKEELYGLQDQTIDAQIAVIDKHFSLGLIDQDTAQAMKEKLKEAKTFIRENGMFHMSIMPCE